MRNLLSEYEFQYKCGTTVDTCLFNEKFLSENQMEIMSSYLWITQGSVQSVICQCRNRRQQGFKTAAKSSDFTHSEKKQPLPFK